MDQVDLSQYAFLAFMSLVAVTIMVGLVLLIKKILNRKPAFEGDMEFDHERIAEELDSEIRHLRDLRNRILPYSRQEEVELEKFAAGPNVIQQKASSAGSTGGSKDAPAVEPGQEGQEPVAATGEVAETVTEAAAGQSAENDAKIKELQDEISTLKQKLTDAETQAAAGGAGGDENALEEQRRALQTQINDKDEQIKELTAKNEQLEKIVGEYQLFEEDFALVKKYKTENDLLRKELMDKQDISPEDVDALIGSAQEKQEAQAPAAEAETPATEAQAPAAEAEAPAAETEAEAPTAEAQAPAAEAEAPTAEAQAPAAEAQAPAAEASELDALDMSSEENKAATEGDPQTLVDDVLNQATAETPADPEAAAVEPEAPAAEAEATGGDEKETQATTAEELVAETAPPKEEGDKAVEEDELMAEFEKLLTDKEGG